MNPYLKPVRCQWLREGHHGGARALQDLAFNLYNGRAWAVDTRRICRLSEEHSDAALSMCMDDRIQGEQSEASTALCREIATERLGQPQADGD